MKKSEMIKKIQERDAKLYLQIKQHELSFGRDSNSTTAFRNEWMGIYSLMKELNIKSDYSLIEWEISMKINEEIKMIEQFEADDFAKRDLGYSI